MFKEGNYCAATEGDLDAIVEFINNGVLDQIKRFEEVDMSDLDEVSDMYIEASMEDAEPAQSVLNYFKNFSLTPTTFLDKDSLEYKWKRVMDWVVAETIKDCSIMIKWKEINEDGRIRPELIDLKLIDIDTKLCTKIPDYRKDMYSIFCGYAEFVYNPEKYPINR